MPQPGAVPACRARFAASERNYGGGSLPAPSPNQKPLEDLLMLLLLLQRSSSWSFHCQMAQQGCESCQKWREHYCQEHMDVNRTRFFKLMTGDFAQCIVCKKDPCMHKHFDNMVGQQAEHCILSNSDDTSTPLRLIESAHKASAPKKVTGKKKSREGPEFPDSSSYHVKRKAVYKEEQSDDRHAGSDYYYSKSANILAEYERKEIFSLASIQPRNPAFVTILQKTHISHKNNFLVVHSGFEADHLEMRSHEILLLRPNRKEKWYVKYYHGSSATGFNCRRWVKFVSDNRLHKDDVCIFELKKCARRKTMVVHVIRKVNGSLYAPQETELLVLVVP
ncbi:hypothetical protein PR202_ga12003 [Eleusine coracana subsp. coracana]|uniref:TF-B3 domain-containing protein n=1 Tax=Eleusine coracana subsp. coracana TaxID=191504 RepID=A0AAV5CAG1_ELECO|nr:hypothetical protein PR202_ga12003 [Eleusine coracana subsp. coracana]